MINIKKKIKLPIYTHYGYYVKQSKNLWMERTDWDTIYQDIMDNGFFLLFLLSNVIKDDVF